MLSCRRELRTAVGKRGTCQLAPWGLEAARVNPALQPLELHDSSLPQPPAARAKENPPCGALGRAEPCPAGTWALGLGQQQPAQVECGGCERRAEKH